jgi:hypothetical protein
LNGGYCRYTAADREVPNQPCRSINDRGGLVPIFQKQTRSRGINQSLRLTGMLQRRGK